MNNATRWKSRAAALTAALLLMQGCVPRTGNAGSGMSAAPSGESAGAAEQSDPPENEPESGAQGEPAAASSLSEPEGGMGSMIEQPDPTLQENIHGSFYVWLHDEYKAFGDPADYVEAACVAVDYDMESAGLEPDTANLALSIPPCCFMEENGRLCYDGGFQNGGMPVGNVASGYYAFGDGETLKENAHLPFEFFTMHPLSGEKYTMRESEALEPGAYVERENYIRYVTNDIGPKDNRLLGYVIDLGGGHFTYASFSVAGDAPDEALTLYDAIVESIRLT